MGKKWWDFGDLDLILKVTPALWMSNFDKKKSLSALYLLNRMMDLSQTLYILYQKNWLDFGDLDLIFKVTTL